MLFSYAVIIPMANEENDFESFVSILKDELDRIGSGSVYLPVQQPKYDMVPRSLPSHVSAFVLQLPDD